MLVCSPKITGPSIRRRFFFVLGWIFDGSADGLIDSVQQGAPAPPDGPVADFQVRIATGHDQSYDLDIKNGIYCKFRKLTMTSRLERKWWFSLPISVLAVLLTLQCMHSAGIERPYNFSQWILYFLCFAGLQRGFSFVGWLLVLAFSPQSKVLARTK